MSHRMKKHAKIRRLSKSEIPTKFIYLGAKICVQVLHCWAGKITFENILKALST